MKWKVVGLHDFMFFKQILFFFSNSVIKSESLVKKKKVDCICIFQANSTILAKVFVFLALQVFIAM